VRVVLDAEAVIALLERGHPARHTVRRIAEAARRLWHEVAIPSVTRAELYRGAHRSHALDALLARQSNSGPLLPNTERGLARLVGGVLAQAGVGSEHMVAAHAVAVAVEDGGGVIITGDPNDLGRLAGPYRTIVVEGLAARA